MTDWPTALVRATRRACPMSEVMSGSISQEPQDAAAINEVREHFVRTLLAIRAVNAPSAHQRVLLMTVLLDITWLSFVREVNAWQCRGNVRVKMHLLPSRSSPAGLVDLIRNLGAPRWPAAPQILASKDMYACYEST